MTFWGIYHSECPITKQKSPEALPQAERRRGVAPRRPIKIKHEINVEFDKLLNDADHGRLPRHLSKFMTRPAYAYTSAQQKTIFRQSTCDSCSYYYKAEEKPKEECTFPWDDPEDYDLAAYDYLPCKEGY